VIQLVRGTSGPARNADGPATILCGKTGQGRLQRLDLDDEVVDAGAEVDYATGRVVSQLDGDKAAARQPEHGQPAQRRPSTVPTTV
jgi:hypothetical protein